MPQLAAYHRPSTLADAVTLLGQPGRVALAGGTTIRHEFGGDSVDLVDLQALELGSIHVEDGRWTLGATARLDQLVEEPGLPQLVRWAASAELPSTLRTLATVGGTVAAADPESLLAAALLACDAVVGFADGTSRPLDDVLRSGVGATDLIVTAQIDGAGRSAHAATGRTPADTPIVAALGRVDAGGAIRLVLVGVAPTPVLVDDGSIDALDPPGDYRGSAEYRRHLAAVLSARVREELA